jgi:hypothetical protein
MRESLCHKPAALGEDDEKQEIVTLLRNSKLQNSTIVWLWILIQKLNKKFGEELIRLPSLHKSFTWSNWT